MSRVSYCSCKHQKQNGGTGKPSKTLLVNTGHWESPTAKTGWRLLKYYSCCRTRDHLWAVWRPQQGYCGRILRALTQWATVGGGIERVVYQISCAGRALLQIALARAHLFSWNKDIRGWRQKVLPYLLVDTEGTKHSRSSMRTLYRGSSALLCSTSLSIMHKGLGWNKRWGSTGKNISPLNTNTFLALF